MPTETANAIALVQEILKLRERRKNVDDAFARRIETNEQKLRDFIKAGGTTGDSAMDFVIIKHGTPIPEIAQKYRALNEDLERHRNEFILVVEKKPREGMSIRHASSPHARDCMPRPTFTDEVLHIAIIKRDVPFFDPSQGTFTVANEPAALCENAWGSEHVLRTPAREFDSAFSRHVMRVLLRSPEPQLDQVFSIGTSRSIYNVVMGDIAVTEWFRTHGEHYLVVLFKVARLLGKVVAETPEITEVLRGRREKLQSSISKLLKEREIARLEENSSKHEEAQGNLHNALELAAAIHVSSVSFDSKDFSVETLLAELTQK